MKDENLDSEITCCDAHAKYNVCCERKHCRNWIPDPEDNNCVIVAIKNGPKTLQDIGKIYGLTRMRICQIEKTIYEKIKDIC